MYNYLLTSSLGLEALVKKEVGKQGYEISEVQDKAVYFKWDIDAMARMNIWSRFGNILYLVIGAQKRVENFDSYFDAVYSQDWNKYIPKGYEVVIKATSIKSELGSLSTLQALAKKAIVKKLVWDGILQENPSEWKIEVRILLENNTLRILLNTSGVWLHRRGYREMTGQAPLKENIAAALVILSGWKFREPFYDLFCGSGTIAIEALMIAKNMAPGLKRNFAFEDWKWFPAEILGNEKKAAKEKEFDGEYKIYASDIRKEVVESAKRSESFAGLAWQIEFSCQDYSEVIRKRPQHENMWIVSNPPYGLRLEEDDAEWIHEGLAKAFSENNISGGIISSDLEFERRSKTKFKKRKLYNGWELCYFYRKL